MITSEKVFGSYVLTKPTLFASDNDTDESSNKCCCIQNSWTTLTLISVRKYNHDTSIFKFRLPTGSRSCFKLGLPIGGYLLALAPGREHGGGDAVRAYTSITDESDATVEPTTDSSGSFEIICKRYDQWGMKESIETHFLFTKTDHSYRPPGAVSNYLHSLQPGSSMQFKFNASCEGRIRYPFPSQVKFVTMIAVGVGVAPMIQTIRALLRDSAGIQVVLLYGVRTVRDILMRELLDEWHTSRPDAFRVVYCVGSRWSNVHFGVKTKGRSNSQYRPPPPPDGFADLPSAELGWVDGDKIQRHGFPPDDSVRVLVCGLPGVYDKLCGPRDQAALSPGSVLAGLGYSSEMVIKL